MHIADKTLTIHLFLWVILQFYLALLLPFDVFSEKHKLRKQILKGRALRWKKLQISSKLHRFIEYTVWIILCFQQGDKAYKQFCYDDHRKPAHIRIVEAGSQKSICLYDFPPHAECHVWVFHCSRQPSK